ncbi:MAG: response regulator [Spirochaetota bacterium]
MSEQEINDFSEIFETIENLEQSLMEFEDALYKGEENESLIHIIFRYAHNLKSSLAMAHKQFSSELIHSVEGNFDLVRGGKKTASTQLIDRSLHAIDLIKMNLERDKESVEELKEVKTALDRLMQATEEVKKAAISFPLSKPEMETLLSAISRKYTVYQIEKLIKTDIDEASYKDLPIYQDIAEIGVHIATYPPFDKIDRKNTEGVIKILFASDKSGEELFYTIFDPFKPVDVSEAATVVKQEREKMPVLEKAKTAEKATPVGEIISPLKTKRLKILIVEDDFVTRHLEMRLLSEFGDCEVAIDGEEAAVAFELKMLDNDPYDLVLLDIMIPKLDGHQVLKRMREFEAAKGFLGLERTKVIVVSNLQDMDTITKSFKEQSDAYIVKPVTKAEIVRDLRKLGLLFNPVEP